MTYLGLSISFALLGCESKPTPTPQVLLQQNFSANDGVLSFSEALQAGNLDLDPSNMDNPFDEIGYHHNLALDYVFLNFGEGEMLEDPERVCLLGKEYFSQAGYSVGGFSCPPERTFSEEELDLSQDAMSYLNQLYDMVATYGDYDLENSPAALIAAIKSLEEDILASSLTNYEKQALLSGTSIGRYTSLYWHMYVTGRFPYTPPPGSLSLKPGIGGMILGSDIAGALGGLPGGVAGSLFGAWAMSTWEALNQYWDQ